MGRLGLLPPPLRYARRADMSGAEYHALSGPSHTVGPALHGFVSSINEGSNNPGTTMSSSFSLVEAMLPEALSRTGGGIMLLAGGHALSHSRARTPLRCFGNYSPSLLEQRRPYCHMTRVHDSSRSPSGPRCVCLSSCKTLHFVALSACAFICL